MAQLIHILTANRLRDGEVVYGRAGAWTRTLAEADMFADKETADAALKAADAAVNERIVVAPYLFEAHIEGGVICPVKEREIIRAAGPTVRTDLGKQANDHVPV
ncbi:MAG: DUF2849 domain-containing protein [Xanthobacteraceae bacterium]